MKPVDQTTFGVPGGNCFSACVASLLGLPTSEVPYFMDETPPRLGWYRQLDDWLEPRGLYAVHFDIDPARCAWPKGYYILGGNSPRGPHAVVARAGELVHDPHPSRSGLVLIDGMTLILPLDLEARP